jgi:hypothetical protein
VREQGIARTDLPHGCGKSFATKEVYMFLKGNVLRLKNLWLFIGAAIIATLIVGVACSHYECSRAEKLVAVLSDIEVGYTSEDHAKDLTAKFSRFRNPRLYESSKDKTIFDEFDFDNGLFGYFPIRSPKYIQIMIGYKDGAVVEKYFRYFDEMRNRSALVREEYKRPDEAVDYVSLIRKDGRAMSLKGVEPPILNILVDDDNTVSPERRKLDWQIDLTCLSRLWGCNDMGEVLRGALIDSAASH